MAGSKKIELEIDENVLQDAIQRDPSYRRLKRAYDRLAAQHYKNKEVHEQAIKEKRKAIREWGNQIKKLNGQIDHETIQINKIKQKIRRGTPEMNEKTGQMGRRISMIKKSLVRYEAIRAARQASKAYNETASKARHEANRKRPIDEESQGDLCGPLQGEGRQPQTDDDGGDGATVGDQCDQGS